jgi:tetratricopeptide (TPR) repeat protein
MLHRLFFLALLLGAASGCATPLAELGDHAYFSPAFRGYVMARHDGSDDPASDEPVLLLRDPLTGSKLRCREEVERWRELHEDLAVDRIRDERAGIAAGTTAGVIFGPLAALQPLGAVSVYQALLVGSAMYQGLSSDDAYELLEQGFALHRRKRHAQAAARFERALAKDPAIGVLSKAYFFLGIAYLEQKKHDDARLALLLFQDRAAVRDVVAFRKAEARLAELGLPTEICAREPVKIHW